MAPFVYLEGGMADMAKFLGKRLLSALVTIFLLSIIIFTISHMSKGDPAQIILGAEATEEQITELRHSLKLDRPVVEQYIDWIFGAVRGDLGDSYYTGEPVLAEVASRLVPSLRLAIMAEILAVIVAIPAGVFAAKNKGRGLDYMLSTTSLLGLSIPNFLMSLILILVFGVAFKALPVSGYRTLKSGVGVFLKYSILPVLALGLGQAGILMRMTRSSMLEVMNTDYIKTAKAKGAKSTVILFKHALRNAFIPILTAIGQSFGTLFAGTAIVETIFNIPGVGQLVVTSITRRDISDRVGVMYLGHLVELAGTEELYNNPLHPYTQALLSTVPEPDPHVKREQIMLKGDIPSPLNPPSGCIFHNRCPYNEPICQDQMPPLVEIKPGHFVACYRHQLY